MKKYILVTVIFLGQKFGTWSQTQAYQSHPFQAIDGSFILTSLGNQIVEVTNRLIYLQPKQVEIGTFGYDLVSNCLFTLEYGVEGVSVQLRTYDSQGKAVRATISFDEPVKKLTHNSGVVYAINREGKQTKAYTLKIDQQPQLAFASKTSIVDLTYSIKDSCYYFCSEYTIYKVGKVGSIDAIYSATHPIKRVVSTNTGILFSTSEGIYKLSDQVGVLVLPKGGYFDVCDDVLYYWGQPLEIKKVSIKSANNSKL